VKIMRVSIPEVVRSEGPVNEHTGRERRNIAPRVTRINTEAIVAMSP